jgi:hypothetical protein
MAPGVHKRGTVIDSSSVVCVIASHSRPFNLAHIVPAVLASSRVTRVVVSNHDPAVRLDDWIEFTDARLRVVTAKRRSGCGTRWRVAREENVGNVLVVDDDVFLSAVQVDSLIDALFDRPETIHGYFGSRRIQPSGYAYFESVDCSVDVLHRAYAVTRAHIESFFVNLRRLWWVDSRLARAAYAFADDLLISQSAGGAPSIHNFGRVAHCRTLDIPGYSTSRRPGFHECRAHIATALSRLAMADSAGPGVRARQLLDSP